MLIFALAFVPVRRANAVAPAIPAAVYYAIAATGTACGIYALNKDSLDYMVSDYWNSCGEYIQRQWQWLGEYGYMVGKMTIDGALTKTVIDYLNENYVAGENVVTLPPTELYDASIGEYYDLESFSIMGQSMSLGPDVVEIKDSGRAIWSKDIMVGSTVIHTLRVSGMGAEQTRLNWIKVMITGTGYYDYIRFCKSSYYNPSYPDEEGSFDIPLYEIAYKLGVSVSQLFYEWGETVTLNMVGDSAGFGSALAPEQEVKVPCPPVPPAEWPDRWIDDLERDLNNTTADRYVETMDDEFDWYIDKDGHIYKKPKGEPPKKDDDTKLVPPVPLPFDPIHPQPGEPGPATPDMPFVPAEPCPYCPPNPHPLNDPCPNPYCPNNPAPQAPPYPATPGDPAEPCPYCPPNPNPNTDPCPNPYCPNNPAPQAPPAIPDAPVPDDRYIDFGPLKRVGTLFTWKFPFSLPWDLKRIMQSIAFDGEMPEFEVMLPGFGGEITYTIKIPEEFSFMIPGIRTVFLVGFMVSLLWGTRKLMGGDV